jgi:hypothetical protein
VFRSPPASDLLSFTSNRPFPQQVQALDAIRMQIIEHVDGDPSRLHPVLQMIGGAATGWDDPDSRDQHIVGQAGAGVAVPLANLDNSGLAVGIDLQDAVRIAQPHCGHHTGELEIAILSPAPTVMPPRCAPESYHQEPPKTSPDNPIRIDRLRMSVSSPA